MVLGKLMPPHMGHLYLVHFAKAHVERLAVVVEHVKGEPIPSALRVAWMKELAPFAEIVHLEDENPQDPSEHPEFWEIWRASLERVLPFSPDFVFASEAYGGKLAEVLGARFVPVDPARSVVPIRATRIREDPFACFEHLPPPVRAYYTRRVSVFGPESTGKSTLAAHLARAFDAVLVPEHARTYLEAQGGRIDATDIEPIARGQLASEDVLARSSRGLLVADTDVLATAIWSETLFGRTPSWIEEEAATRRYDLTLLLDVDVPWVGDQVRYLPRDRRGFFERCERALSLHGRRVVVVRGGFEERARMAEAAVAELVGRPPERAK
jgi:NadR type nicotinamide-nucleotide adenylyltransferase